MWFSSYPISYSHGWTKWSLSLSRLSYELILLRPSASLTPIILLLRSLECTPYLFSTSVVLTDKLNYFCILMILLDANHESAFEFSLNLLFSMNRFYCVIPHFINLKVAFLAFTINFTFPYSCVGSFNHWLLLIIPTSLTSHFEFHTVLQSCCNFSHFSLDAHYVLSSTDSNSFIN